MTTGSFDTLERRCPRLGSIVHFGYCRMCEAERQPCFKVLDCWWERFDVQDVMRRTLSNQAFEHLAHPTPPDKLSGLVALIAQARRRIDSEK